MADLRVLRPRGSWTPVRIPKVAVQAVRAPADDGTSMRGEATSKHAVRMALAVGTALAALLLAAVGAPRAEALACNSGTTFGTFSGVNAPSACWRPYATGSPFNKPIPADARIAADSAAIVVHMLRYGYHFSGDSHGFTLQSQGSRPVYWSSPSDPVVTVDCTAYWGPNTCQGANGYDINGIQIPIPAGAQPEQQWDGHMIVVDQADNAEYDFERASWTGPNQLTVWSGSEIPISGPGATGLGGNADAGSFGLLGGVIRPEELEADSINHALAISVPCTSGYVWPAQGPWGMGCGSIGQDGSATLQMGDLLQLNMTPGQIAASGAPAWQQAIMRAMARYGMYINDTNGGADNQGLELDTQDDESFTSLGEPPQMADAVQALGGSEVGSGDWMVDGVAINPAKLRVVAACVQQGTCPATEQARLSRKTRRHKRHHHKRDHDKRRR